MKVKITGIPTIKEAIFFIVMYIYVFSNLTYELIKKCPKFPEIHIFLDSDIIKKDVTDKPFIV
jgi:hypothetical protein